MGGLLAVFFVSSKCFAENLITNTALNFKKPDDIVFALATRLIDSLCAIPHKELSKYRISFVCFLIEADLVDKMDIKR